MRTSLTPPQTSRIKASYPNCVTCPRCGNDTLPKFAPGSLATAVACQWPGCGCIVNRNGEVEE